jgi:hypothetical protein
MIGEVYCVTLSERSQEFLDCKRTLKSMFVDGAATEYSSTELFV